LLLDRFTVTPPNGAVALSVTVPVEPLPPTTPEGATEILARIARPGAGDVTVSVVLTELDEAAVMLTP